MTKPMTFLKCLEQAERRLGVFVRRVLASLTKRLLTRVRDVAPGSFVNGRYTSNACMQDKVLRACFQHCPYMPAAV